MKRLLLVLLFLLPLVLLSIWLAKRPDQPWNVKTTMTFLGFTNAVPGAPPTNALFGFNNIPSGNASWEAYRIGQFDGTNWVFPKAQGFFGFFQPGGNFAGGATNYFLRGTIQVGSTSAPTRVVMRLVRGPSGPIEEIWTEAKRRIAPILGLQKSGAGLAAGPQYFMTNDFNFTSSTPSPP